MASTFPIPASLQDLEREPYNLLPYPHDFNDEDESARAESFGHLVDLIDNGTSMLLNEGLSLFVHTDGHCDPWMDGERIQAMYTLVRKSTSLGPDTRMALVRSLCRAVTLLSQVLDEDDPDPIDSQGDSQNSASNSIMPLSFRDAFACHLYMLFSVMFFMESEAKISGNLKSRSKKRSDNTSALDSVCALRSTCANAMLTGAKCLSKNKHKMWKFGVPDEEVAILPCRIAFQMLESATGVVARRVSSGDAALAMIAATVDSSETILTTIVAALMDLLHSYEHMAPLCAELCCMVSEKPVNRLAVELMREIGRLDTNGHVGNESTKASGIKFVSPFISDLAALRPRLVMANISYLLPHLNSEPYCLRSSLIMAIGHILEHSTKSQQAAENLRLGTEDEGDLDEEEDQLERTDPASSLEIQRKRVDSLWKIMLKRAHDSNSFTRSAVLKVWIRLVQNHSVPVGFISTVLDMAVDRLQDKTVVARKQAMQLVTVLLENNPFLGDLDPEPYRSKLVEYYEYIKNNLPDDLKEARDAELMNITERGDDEEEALAKLDEATLAAAISKANEMSECDQLEGKEAEYKAKVDALAFAQAALDFIQQFEDAAPKLYVMLLSANQSDIIETIRFFVKAYHFKLPLALQGIKQSLSLMWSTEQIIKDEVLQSFVDVFINKPGEGSSTPLNSERIAYNLISLAIQGSASEVASIEEAISSLVKAERIPADVFSTLWTAASTSHGKSRSAAIQVLAMGARADRNIVDSKSRLRILLDIGLGDHTEENKDWDTARATAVALQRVERATMDQTCAKYLVLERIIEQLCAVARGEWCVDEDAKDTLRWFSAAEQSIAALFIISPAPEVVCTEIVRGIYARTFEGPNADRCHPHRLSRFFHVIGHIAISLLVYTEDLSGIVRRANAKKTLKKQEEADKKKQESMHKENEEEDAIEAELGMAAELEAENERKVAEIAEKKIVGTGLLSVFGPLLARVVSNEKDRFSSAIVRQTSTLALCKFMCVSSTFCEKHLPVLFAALANAPIGDTTMRANTVVALGDLAFRFPNEVEPYTPRLYACLRDKSTNVRRHTLMVLTHLILNDMVKVKGQVCEIAMCLRDDDPRICDMSRLLFHELSKRSNNPVYNLLPDIISQLSLASIEREDFRYIMGFLLGFIKKEKQNEMLVDKLCQRIPKCESTAQQSDIAYCMSQLKINERSVKYLVDNTKMYKDALRDEEVKRHFLTISNKAKKFAKPEMKVMLDDWESKLEELAEMGMENHAAGENAAKATKSRNKKKGGQNKRTRRVVVNHEEESEDEGPIDDESDSEGEVHCIGDQKNCEEKTTNSIIATQTTSKNKGLDKENLPGSTRQVGKKATNKNKSVSTRKTRHQR